MSTKKMNVLAIGSHPDDIEFGCGGTLHKLAARGHKVYLMVLTSGNAGGNFSIRKKEQMKAAC
jgi:LmbE family N-acetylglucosaminyl deacetylase